MKRHPYTHAILMLLLAFAFRTYQLATQSLSGDEAFTITQWATANLQALFNHIAKIDPQPPLALLSYYTWIHLTGHSEFAARLLSALFSLITVAGTFALSRRIFRPPFPFILTLIAATNPFQLWYAQDARPYSEWMALSLLAILSLLRALPSRRASLWLLYIVFASLALQTFYLEIFSFLASALYAFSHFMHTKRLSRAWLASQLSIICLYIPWILYSQPQNNPYQPTASFPNIPATLTELAFGTSLPTSLLAPVTATIPLTPLDALLLLATTAAIVLIFRLQAPTHKYLILAHIIIPILLLTALSAITHKAFFRARYVAATSIPLALLLIAIPATILQTKRQSHTLLYLFSVPLLTLNIMSLTHYHFNPQYAKAPPWRDIATILQRDAAPNDIIIQNYPDPAFNYYYTGPASTIILPSTENPPAATTIAQLLPLPTTYRHIWFLPIDTPFWDRDQVVAHWLTDNTAYLTDTWIRNMRLYQYASWETTSANIDAHLDYNMGLVILRGYHISPPPPYSQQTGSLTLELFWQPLRPTASALSVFVHLITTNQDGTLTLWAQDDHPPQQGRLPTTSWPTTRAIFRDVYTIQLPPALPDGSYTLTTGFYNPTTATRHPLPTSLPQPEQDSVQITTIKLSTPK